MSTTPKHAWFNLVIVVLGTVAVAALSPVLGIQRAQGGFAVLGLLGLGPFLFRGRRGTVMSDERDELIRRRSVMIAYGVFWVVFVAACVSAPFFYGSRRLSEKQMKPDKDLRRHAHSPDFEISGKSSYCQIKQ